MNHEILICPKCGGEPETITTYDTEYVQCKICGHKGEIYVGDYYDEGFMDGTYAIHFWNEEAIKSFEIPALDILINKSLKSNNENDFKKYFKKYVELLDKNVNQF
jgi:hypothetical protein